jgi:hypothetical protein
MSNLKYPKYKSDAEIHNNNKNFLETKTNNKKFESMNNFNIFTKMNKLEEEFEIDYDSNNLVNRIFNQIKLSNANIKKDYYGTAYIKRETNTAKENKDLISKQNNLMNEEAFLVFKNNNCLNLKHMILRNSDKMKIKTSKNNEKMPNRTIDNLDMDINLKTEEKLLITNEHIINNYASLNYKNETFTEKNLNFNEEDLENSSKEYKAILIKDKVIEENKKWKNSKNREDYKKLLMNDNIKLRKNISAVLNKQEDLYKYLENHFCPIISKNFEKEKNRFNKIYVLSANPNKKPNNNKSQNSFNDANEILYKKENFNKKKVDEEVKIIQEENRLIPRKFKTANYTNKRITNLITANSKKEENINYKFQYDHERNFISKINRIKRPKDNQEINSVFLTNMNKLNLKKPNQETELVSKRYIFTPDVNIRNNSYKNEVCFHQNFPARTILKIKNEEENNVLKNKGRNIKNSDVYYKSKKKIQVFQSVKENKISLHNKNLSRDLEFNNVFTKNENTSDPSEREIITNEDFNCLFGGKNDQNKSKRDLEHLNVNDIDDKESSFLNVINSKSNSNKKLINSANSKIDLLIELKVNKVDIKSNFDEKNLKIGEELSLKKSENKEDNFDPIEKELNFSRVSSDDRDEVCKDYEENIGSYRNLFNYKSKLNFDKNEIFTVKHNLDSNLFPEEKYVKIKNSNKRQYVFNNSVNKIVPNKSASNFFSKIKIFSYSIDDKFKNTDYNFAKENENDKFTSSINVKKIKFAFDKNHNKVPMFDIYQNKTIQKTSVVPEKRTQLK